MFVFWFFHRPVVIITDAQLVKEVLITKNLPKDKFGYSHLALLFGERMLGQGLLSEVSEEEWHWKRATLDPGFYRPSIVGMMESFNMTCDSFLQRLETLADGKAEVSMAEELVRINLDVIAKVAFDLDLNSTNNPDTPIPINIRIALEGLIQSFRKPFMRFQPSTFGYQAKCREAVRFVRGVAKEVIEKRLKAKMKGEDQHNDLLSHILLLPERDSCTTMDDMVDHFMSFVVGGEETVSNHLTFLLAAITSHPRVEERIVAEIDEVLGSRCAMRYEDLARLKYLEQASKEALRLHPPEPAITRVANESMTLGDYHIPARTSIMVNAYVLHHHSNYWDNPEEFDPERFSASNQENVEHYAYFPFSLGRHTCIGIHFAHVETKLLIARLLQTFKFNLLPGQDLKQMEHMTLSPKNGVRCTLSLR
ncbi:Cholesterol 24-hydroxylase [Stylophora pistillata]|uniref:Cholesterol 24-hydroxylase n=2 Tax=Stylophora pistillata TaxID=50429 RepID=A0A2B4SUU4_STYPI|nr:Cholesterol 24-hydroxylase [Stylophora pistillata]